MVPKGGQRRLEAELLANWNLKHLLPELRGLGLLSFVTLEPHYLQEEIQVDLFISIFGALHEHLQILGLEQGRPIEQLEGLFDLLKIRTFVALALEFGIPLASLHSARKLREVEGLVFHQVLIGLNAELADVMVEGLKQWGLLLFLKVIQIIQNFIFFLENATLSL